MLQHWSLVWSCCEYTKLTFRDIVGCCRRCLVLRRSIQSWKLADIKRDDYAPNTPGQRQWEMDRKKWLATRLVDVVKVCMYTHAHNSAEQSH